MLIGKKIKLNFRNSIPILHLFNLKLEFSKDTKNVAVKIDYMSERLLLPPQSNPSAENAIQGFVHLLRRANFDIKPVTKFRSKILGRRLNLKI